MLIILLAYLGGMLTIVSPCILPVLPFVFARAGRSFARSTLPMLAGMAATFAIVATLAAVGGGWAVRANQVGRWAALVLLALFGVALVFLLYLAFQRRVDARVIGGALVAASATLVLTSYLAVGELVLLPLLGPLVAAWTFYVAAALSEYLRERESRRLERSFAAARIHVAAGP